MSRVEAETNAWPNLFPMGLRDPGSIGGCGWTFATNMQAHCSPARFLVLVLLSKFILGPTLRMPPERSFFSCFTERLRRHCTSLHSLNWRQLGSYFRFRSPGFNANTTDGEHRIDNSCIRNSLVCRPSHQVRLLLPSLCLCQQGPS